MTKKNKKYVESSLLTVEFVISLREGDHEAFAALYLHVKQPLRSFIYSLLKSDSEADDITQEVFVKIWERRQTIDIDRNIKSLIFMIAKNTIMNRLNRQKVIERYSQSERLIEDFSKTPEELLIARETELIIDLAVSKMPHMRRIVYELSVTQQLSHEEIAEELNITKENVANHLSHAKKEIHEILAALAILL